eukprot:1193534-Prorocentrum_minimum.AAC.4
MLMRVPPLNFPRRTIVILEANVGWLQIHELLSGGAGRNQHYPVSPVLNAFDPDAAGVQMYLVTDSWVSASAHHCLPSAPRPSLSIFNLPSYHFRDFTL